MTKNKRRSKEKAQRSPHATRQRDLTKNQPPFSILVCFHPQSEIARKLAKGVYQTFMEQPGQPGLRLPVQYCPTDEHGIPQNTEILLDYSEYTLVVFLVDHRMARQAEKQDRLCAKAWADWLVELLAQSSKPENKLKVLPVAVDDGAFHLDQRLDFHSHIRLDVFSENQKGESLIYKLTVSALELLRPEYGSKVQFFISHAKADLPKDLNTLAEGPVKSLLAHLSEEPIAGWYDAKEIPPGGRFDREISKGILECSALIGILTNEYSSREWCRREVLEAKDCGRPMVLVDAVEYGSAAVDVPRIFPYLGNVPMLRWEGANPGAEARRIAGVALREALRYEHTLMVLAANKQAHDVVLGMPPEFLTLSNLPEGTKRVLYPDPPLGREELDRLQRVVPKIELTTALSQVERFVLPVPKRIGLSLSTAEDTWNYGASVEHLATVSDDLVIFLLLSGLELGYGGMLGFQGSGQDYVQRLFGLVKSYSPLAKQLDRELAPIVNYVGWPIHLSYGDEQYNLYGGVAHLEKIEQPALPGVQIDALYPKGTPAFFKADTPERRFAWACSMTKMRERMADDLSARVAIGGAIHKYNGLYPGVVEEAILALRARQPLYLVGGFGGAARLVFDLLTGKDREEMTTAWLRQCVSDFDAVVALYQRSGVSFVEPDKLVAYMKNLGASGIAGVLYNGLDEEENRELGETLDHTRIITLILRGMRNVFAGT